MHPYQTPPRWRLVARYLAVVSGSLLLVAALGLLLLTLRPALLGRDSELRSDAAAYSAAGLHVEEPGFSLEWREGRMRVVRQEGEIVGALFEGEGEVALTTETFGASLPGPVPEPRRFRVKEAFLSLNGNEWSALVNGREQIEGAPAGDALLERVVKAEPRLPVERLLNRLPGLTSRSHYVAGPEVELWYRASPQVVLRVREPAGTSSFNLGSSGWWALPFAPTPRSALPLGTLGLVVGLLVLVLLAWVLTSDLRHHRRTERREEPPASGAWLGLLLILPAADVALTVATASGAPWGPVQTLKLGVAGLTLLFLALSEANGFRRLGLAGGYPLRSLAAGVALALLAVGAIHLDFPYGLVPERLAAWPREAFVAFIELGLLTELYRRGFLQRELERRIGPWPAVAAVALFSAGLQFFLRESDPLLFSLPPWAALLTTILSPLVYGLLLLRTRSIWGGTVARGLYEWLSRILLFG